MPSSAKSYSFISEDSFSTHLDVPLDIVELVSAADEAADVEEEMKRIVEFMQTQKKAPSTTTMGTGVASAFAVSSPSASASQQQASSRNKAHRRRHESSVDTINWQGNKNLDDRRSSNSLSYTRSISSPVQMQSSRPKGITFEHLGDMDMPVVCRQSQQLMTPSIQLLEAPMQELRTMRPDDLQPSAGFNSALYQSLRHGEPIALFSKRLLGLVVTAAAMGFLRSFLLCGVHPLLSVYLALDDDQTTTSKHFLQLTDAFAVFIGIISDFYPVWNLHRKPYIVLGWAWAYVMIMGLLAAAMYDDTTSIHASNVRTFCGGIFYDVLLVGAQFGVTIASVVATSYVVELAQREPIHDRGTMLLQFLFIRETFATLAAAFASSILSEDPRTGLIKSTLSLKFMILLVAFVAVVPIFVVLKFFEEEKREVKVDAVDRKSLSQGMWYTVQKHAVWHVVLFYTSASFFVYFVFSNAQEAVQTWANVTFDAAQYGDVAIQAVIVVVLHLYRVLLLNSNWVRVAITGLCVWIAVHVGASISTIYGIARSPWFYLSLQACSGISRVMALVLGNLPLIEITEIGLEGATTGLVWSLATLVHMVVDTLADAMRRPTSLMMSAFSPSELKLDAASTRSTALAFVLGQGVIHALALVPILYLLPHQKLEIQQMRSSGAYHRGAGIVIIVLFAVLLLYGVLSNVVALVV